VPNVLVVLSQASEQSWGDRVCGFVDPMIKRIRQDVGWQGKHGVTRC